MIVFERGFFPKAAVTQQARDQSGVHRVPSAVSNYIAENLFTQQGQVTDEVKHFVAHELIIKAQGRIHETVSREDYSIFRRSTANQSLLAHGVGFMQKAKSARRCNLPNVVSIGQVDRESLLTDKGVGKVDGVRNRIALGRVHGNELVAFPQFQFAPNPEVRSGAPLLANSCFADGINKWPGAAIQNRQLKIIELD